MSVTRRDVLKLLAAGVAVSAIPAALLEKVGGAKLLTSGAARITTLTALGATVVWELPFVELAHGLKLEYLDLPDPPILVDVPRLEVRENANRPWRQVGLVDSATLELPPMGQRDARARYGKLEILEGAS